MIVFLKECLCFFEFSFDNFSVLGTSHSELSSELMGGEHKAIGESRLDVLVWRLVWIGRDIERPCHLGHVDHLIKEAVRKQ